MPEAVRVVACLHDVSVMGESIQQGCGRLGVAEDARPFPEGQVGRDHHAGVLVKLREQVEEQAPPG